MNWLRRGNKGFTLIEILIVLALLAILAAVVVPNLTGFLTRGGERAYNTDRDTIQTAVDAYKVDHVVGGKYQDPIKGADKSKGGKPQWNDTNGNGVRDSGEDWKTVGGVKTNAYFIKFEELVNKKYLAEIPQSASRDNKSGLKGSYGWYVDANGKVNAYYYPSVNKYGYQGIYP
jgi:prepilin-type N-terminal cleavage/methylation domain-containing protein